MRRNGLPDEARFTGVQRRTHAAPLRFGSRSRWCFFNPFSNFRGIARSCDQTAKQLAHALLNLGIRAHGPRGGRLNGEENDSRTPRARPVPRGRVAAASLRGVARSRDWLAAAAA